MNRTDRFDDIVSDWLHADAEHRVPEHLDAVLRRTGTERQRPAWSSLERWLPVQTTLRFSPAPRIAWLLVVLGLILALGAAALWVGSRQRLPAPFGPARNGAMVSSHDGDIYAVDAVTHTERLSDRRRDLRFRTGLLAGRDEDSCSFGGPPAPCGDEQGLSLAVANADGTEIRVLTPYVQRPRLGRLVAGQQADRLPVAQDREGARGHQRRERGRKWADHPGRRPVGPFPVVVAALRSRDRLPRWTGHADATAGPGIWAVHPDGTGLRQLSTRPATDQFDYSNPGGRAGRIAGELQRQWHGRPDPRPRSPDRRRHGPPGPPGSRTSWAPVLLTGWTPDRVRQKQPGERRVPVRGRPGRWLGIGTPLGPIVSQPSGDINWIFTPDGSAVVVDYGEEGVVRMLPIDGSPGTVLTRGDLSFADIQRLAP